MLLSQKTRLVFSLVLLLVQGTSCARDLPEGAVFVTTYYCSIDEIFIHIISFALGVLPLSRC
jgi:hypothetical protein